MDDEVPILELELDPTEQAAVAALGREDLEIIDSIVLAHSRPKWRKVAMILSLTMRDLKERHPELSDIFYARRVAALVEEHRLEARGDISFIRFSEVRLPDSSAMPSV